MPNQQTKLGFQQQKAGSRRVVNRKPTAEEKKNVENTEKPTQADTSALLNNKQTMEDKLRAYIQKKKEAQEADKRPQRPTTRSTGILKRKIAQAREEPTSSATKESLSVLFFQKETIELETPTTCEINEKQGSSTEDQSERAEKKQDQEETAELQDALPAGAREEASDTEPLTIPSKPSRKQAALPEPQLATPPASSPIAPSPEDDEEEQEDEGDNIHVVARKSVRARPLYIAEGAPDPSIASKLTTAAPTTRPRASARSAALHARLARISATYSTASQGNLDDIETSSSSSRMASSSSSVLSTKAAMSAAGLPLPKSLETLFKLFRGLDHIVRFHQHQGNQCFYHKVRRQVERVASQNFEIRHLAQIKTLYPEAFEFSAAPCLHEGKKLRSYLIELKAEKGTTTVEEDNEVERGASAETNTRFIPLENQRRDAFRDRLVQYVYDHHQAFLQSTVPPRTDPYPLAWHPKFELECVPEVPKAELPELEPRVVANDPNFELRSLGTKASRLSPSVASSIPSPTLCEPQPEAKSHGSSSGSKEATADNKKNDVPHGPTSPSTSGLLPGARESTNGNTTTAPGPGDNEGSTTTTEKDDMIPVPKLLSRLEQMKEKIRQKQLQKQLATQGQASKADKALALQRSRLPAIFDMITFLRFKVIAVQALAEKIAYSHKLPLSEMEAKQHLQLLAQELPEWCQIFTVGAGAGSTVGGGDHFKVLETHPNQEKQFRSRLVQLSLSPSSSLSSSSSKLNKSDRSL